MELAEKHDILEIRNFFAKEFENLKSLVRDDKPLTMAGLEDWLGISRRTINRWISDKSNEYAHNPFPVYYAGSEPRFRKELVWQWMEANGKIKRYK